MEKRNNSILEIEEGEENSQENSKFCCKQTEGIEAWLLLARVFVYHVLFGLNYGSFGILYVEYVKHFDAPKGAVGWIASIQICLYSVLGIFVSSPIERWGCHRVGFFGSLLTSFSLAMSSLAPNLPIMYVTQGLLTGLGLSAATIPSAIIVQKHFTDNRALATGISLMGYSCGSLIAPLLVRFLIAEYSWRGALLILSAILLNRAPVAMTFWPPKGSQRPEKTDLCASMFKGAFDFSLFKSIPFTLFCISGILQRMYFLASTHHIPSFAVECGHSLTQAAVLSSIQAFSNMTTRLIVTLIANIPGVNRMAIFTSGLFAGVTVITLLLTAGVVSYWGIVAGAAFNGLHMALSHTVAPVILVELLGIKNISRSIALYAFCTGFSQLIATPLCGFLFDVSGSYVLPFLTIGAAVLVSAVFAICSDVSQRRISKRTENI